MAWSAFDSDLQHATERSEEPEVVHGRGPVYDGESLDLKGSGRLLHGAVGETTAILEYPADCCI